MIGKPNARVLRRSILISHSILTAISQISNFKVGRGSKLLSLKAVDKLLLFHTLSRNKKSPLEPISLHCDLVHVQLTVNSVGARHTTTIFHYTRTTCLFGQRALFCVKITRSNTSLFVPFATNGMQRQCCAVERDVPCRLGCSSKL